MRKPAERFSKILLMLPFLLLLPVASGSADSTTLGSPMSAPSGQKPPNGTPSVTRMPAMALPNGWGSRADRIYQVLSAASSEAQWRRRGAAEARLYAKSAPSVVLVQTNDGFGSGVVVGSKGEILTNWHVVRGAETAGVIYKPKIEGDLAEAEVRTASVAKVDEVADLALLIPENPELSRRPISLEKPGKVVIGADAHAIGHPTGEAWTYTKGVVSQIREGYEWEDTGTGFLHRAAVIQTQTPINPGSSGGPLLGDNGRLVGINTFGSPQSQGLNYAVAASEISRFLSRKDHRRADKRVCEVQILSADRNPDPPGWVEQLDFDCDDVADLQLLKPDQPGAPFIYQVDQNEDGLVDIVFVDADRDGCIESSFWDRDWDGEGDQQCDHTGCDWEPHRCELMK